MTEADEETTAAKLESPANEAVKLCWPTARVVVVKEATPPEIAPVPICVAPSKKVTMPEGAPALQLVSVVDSVSGVPAAK